MRQVDRCYKGNSTSVWWETQTKCLGNISSFFFMHPGSSGLRIVRVAFGWSHDVSWCFLDDVLMRVKWELICIADIVAKTRHLVKPQCPAAVWVCTVDDGNQCNPSVKQSFISPPSGSGSVCSWVCHAAFHPQQAPTFSLLCVRSRLGQRSCFGLSNSAEEAGFVHSLRGTAAWAQHLNLYQTEAESYFSWDPHTLFRCMNVSQHCVSAGHMNRYVWIFHQTHNSRPGSPHTSWQIFQWWWTFIILPQCS